MKIIRMLLLVASVLLRSTTSYSQAQVPAVNMSNVSVLLTLAPGGTATMGFVVGNLPSGQTGAWYIIRAVGPSLTQLGIKNPASLPKMAIFNSKGQNLLELYSTFLTYLYPDSFYQVGAFQLIIGALDAYSIVPLRSGNYTVQVSDSSGKGGAILIEAYASPTPVIGPE
jgi:hypothetical protein